MEFWHFGQCVMHSAAACASCTVSGFNLTQSIGKLRGIKCYIRMLWGRCG